MLRERPRRRALRTTPEGARRADGSVARVCEPVAVMNVVRVVLYARGEVSVQALPGAVRGGKAQRLRESGGVPEGEVESDEDALSFGSPLLELSPQLLDRPDAGLDVSWRPSVEGRARRRSRPRSSRCRGSD